MTRPLTASAPTPLRPSSSATSVWAGTASASRLSERNRKTLIAISWAASVGRSTRAAIAVAPVNTPEHRTGPQEEVSPGRHERLHLGPVRSQRPRTDRVGTRRPPQRATGQDLRTDGRPRRSGHTQTETEHEHDLDDRVEDVCRDEDLQRGAVVARPALGAFGCEADEHERHAERRDPKIGDGETDHPRRRRRSRATSGGANTTRIGAATSPITSGQPGRLDTDIGCTDAVGRTDPVRHPLGGSVREEVRAADHQGEQRNRHPRPHRVRAFRVGRRSPCRRGGTAAPRRAHRTPAPRAR